MLSFFIVAWLVLALLHLYVAFRLLAPSRFGRVGRTIFGVLWAALAIGAPCVFFVDSFLPYPYSRIYRWAAWIYIGGFSTLFALVALRDLALAIGARVAKARGHELSAERRRFLLGTTGNVALGVSTAVTAWGARVARLPPEVVEVEVPIEGLPREFDGYHIVQLSDVHVGETIDKDFILPIIETTTSLAPDLIALTGDFVDGSVRKLRADVSPFEYLRAHDGVLFVTGNHEYYSGVEEWCQRFRDMGIKVLLNQHVLIGRGDKNLLIAGVTDQREGGKWPGHASDPAGAIEGAPPHDTRILLAHQPRSIHEAKRLGYHLQLSGHTHGGQFFPWNLVVGLVQPLSRGLAKFDDTWLYVNRGTCYWGPPNRAGVRAEITSIKLRTA